MKSTFTWLIVAAAIVFMLSALCGYLAHQNAQYAQKAKELLLKNDSISSVNLDLKYELEQSRKARFTTANELNRYKAAAK